MSETKAVQRSVNRFIRVHDDLQELEGLIVEALEDDKDVPQEALDHLGKFVARRGEHIDETARWLTSVEQSIKYLKGQAEMYRDRAKSVENAFVRLKVFLQNYLDINAEGKLIGTALKIRTQKNSMASLRIEDPDAIPDHCKKVVLTVSISNDPAALDLLEAAKSLLDTVAYKCEKSEPIVSETLVRQALEKGEEIPGAKLETGRHLRWDKPKPPKDKQVNGAKTAAVAA